MPDRRPPTAALRRVLRRGRAAAIAALIAMPVAGLAAPAHAAGDATVDITGLQPSIGAAADPAPFAVSVQPNSTSPTEIDLAVSDPAGVSGVEVFGPDGTELTGANGHFSYPTTDFSAPVAFAVRTSSAEQVGSSLTITADVTDAEGTSLSTGADSASTDVAALTATMSDPAPAQPSVADTVTTTVTVTNNTGSSYTGDNAVFVDFTFQTPEATRDADISMSDGTTTTQAQLSQPTLLTGVFPDRNGPGISLADGASHDITVSFTRLATGTYDTHVSINGQDLAANSFAVAGGPAITAAVPGDLGAWADPTAYNVTTSNLDPTACPSPSYHVRITGNQSLHRADVRLQYQDSSDVWRTVTLDEDNGDLDGSTPPGSIGETADYTTRFRIVVNAPFDENADDIALALTRLGITTSIESGGTVCGDATDTDNVKLRLPTLSFGLPGRVHAGASTPFTVSIHNDTGSSYSHLADFSLTLLEKDDINPGDITLSYAGGNHPLPCDAEGLLVCDLTNGRDFSLANGQSLQQRLTMTISKHVRSQQLLMLAAVGQDTDQGQGLADHADVATIVGAPPEARPVTGGGTGGTGNGSAGSGGTLALTGAPTLVPTVLTGLLLLGAGGGLLAFGAAGCRRRRSDEPAA